MELENIIPDNGEVIFDGMDQEETYENAILKRRVEDGSRPDKNMKES